MSTEHHQPHNIDELKDELEHHDDWFRHAPGETSHETHGDFNPYVIMAFLVVTVGIVFGVTLLIVPWFGRMVQAKRVEIREQSTLPVQEFILQSNNNPRITTRYKPVGVTLEVKPLVVGRDAIQKGYQVVSPAIIGRIAISEPSVEGH